MATSELEMTNVKTSKSATDCEALAANPWTAEIPFDTWRTLRDRLPRLIDALQFDPGIDLAAWNDVLDKKILPRFNPLFPVVVAVTGAGGTGKSTLFNSLAGQDQAVVGATAGLTRRVLIGLHPRLLDRPDFLPELFYPFGCIPEPLDNRSELTQPGSPKYVLVNHIPENIVLLDTPDFDVGKNGQYLNRDIAKPVLEASDVLVYVFTNSVYNNLASGTFLHEVAANLGRRKCVLIYRCYESFKREDVVEHCNVVADKLYGDSYSQFVLARYRTHDTNEVASGKSHMQLHSLDGNGEVLEVLSRLDPQQIRVEQTAAARADAIGQARTVLDNARVDHWKCEVYRDAIRIKQGHCVTDALVNVPVRDILAHVIDVWNETSPLPLKALRKTGQVVAAPVKGLFGVARWIKDRLSREPGTAVQEDPLPARLADVENAASELHRSLLNDVIDTSTTSTDPDGKRVLDRIADIRQLAAARPHDLPRIEESTNNKRHIFVGAHNTATDVRAALMDSPWKIAIDAIRKEAQLILSDSPDDELRDEITKIIGSFRKTMSFWDTLRETFFAALHIAPPLIAAVYVFSTGDVVTGGGIWAKVHGLFGLNDLWAVVVLPANLGLSEVDRKQLEDLLGPVLEKWMARRSKRIDQLFTKQISGELLAALNAASALANPVLNDVNDALMTLESSHA